MMRYLSDADVVQLLPTYSECVALVGGALAQVADGRADQPPKVALQLGSGTRFAHAMPAAIDGAGGRIAGVKWISGGGGTKICGVVVVERAGGGLRGVIAAAALTAARTAAVSGAALRAVRTTAVRRVAFIGGGVQAHSHREMLRAEHPDATVSFYSRRSVGEMPLRAGDRIAKDIDDALSGADLLITAAAFGTPPRAFSVGAITPGTTIIVIDYDATLHGEHVALLRAHSPLRLVTDSGAGFNAARAAGRLAGWPEIQAEIGSCAASPSGTTTIVNHLGVAACDLALADLILARAEERGVGTLLA